MLKPLLSCLLSTSMTLGLCTHSQAKNYQLEFLGEKIIPSASQFSATTIGGLSGLDYDPQQNIYYAISDDRSSDARFYTLNIDFDANGFKDIDFIAVTPLQTSNSQAFSANSLDPESIRYHAARNSFFWTSERNENGDPAIREMNQQGVTLKEISIAAKYKPSSGASSEASIGVSNNRGFESLTFTNDGLRAYTATEQALLQDDSLADINKGSKARILGFDVRRDDSGVSQLLADVEYVYEVAAVTKGDGEGFEDNGLVELLALENGNLLSIEREFVSGVGNTIKVYEVDLSTADNVSGKERLDGSEKPVSKELILDFDQLDLLSKRSHGPFSHLSNALDNIEGVTFGPIVDGSPTLVFVSDDNFNAFDDGTDGNADDQFTQFLAFKLVSNQALAKQFDCLLNQVEKNYPELLVSTNSATQTTQFDDIASPFFGTWHYRVYANNFIIGLRNYETVYSYQPQSASLQQQGHIFDLMKNRVAIHCKAEVSGNKLRFATFNASLNRSTAGELITDLSSTDNAQAKLIAETIQRNHPDVLVLQEFDYDADGQALALFQQNYLNISQNNQAAIVYPYSYVVASNTGVASGVDLDGDGATDGLGDAFGFGFHAGQYAFAILSKQPILKQQIRSFQHFLWKDMPNAKLPIDPVSGQSYYSDAALAVFRLSSKNHVDIPIQLANGEIIHVLSAHPTPPVFDGDEDRNGLRNHDEIRLLIDYINGADYLVDDQGQRGGLSRTAKFVILGDMNADPIDGDSSDQAALQFNHVRINQNLFQGIDAPFSQGGIAQNLNDGDQGNPGHDTSTFGLRVDYVLASTDLNVLGSGIFWPLNHDPELGHLIAIDAESGNNLATDHRLVWIDISH